MLLDPPEWHLLWSQGLPHWLLVYDGQKEVARHERLIAKGQARLVLDHYLEALDKEPGAFPGATALEEAKSAGKFTPPGGLRPARPMGTGTAPGL
ncbi:hypothetical protein [Streptomyces africanus]|uniref:hypothetical protein n=1 Tax=Streptomyces africanus TaxID=231024 RepID=UPI001FC9E61B|nr:hypothetical protein [Streptomyces africanus]